MSDKIGKKYFDSIMNQINWKEISPEVRWNDWKDIELALLIQNNLLLSKLIDLMCIATGMSEDEATEQVNQVNSEVIKEKGKYKIICGTCGNGVIPDAMNYCPRCKNDLSQQIAQQIINKGGN